ncbi:MAG: metal-sensitive transcriptional regulator [Candidatus Eremiobacteraeota bacterium]|nr:metal-sensitive transcriptional regulator [Candidatus Eremiobacteraeota bacterium]
MKSRKSSLPVHKKQSILNRLKTARGHLDGIIKLVEDDTYCVQVIKQIAAVRGALDRVSRIELENHLEHCVVEQIQAGESAAALAEVAEILGLRQQIA